MSVDELINFIETNDEKSTKSKKHKNKTKNDKTNKSNVNTNQVYDKIQKTDKTEKDIEIELESFKNKLRRDSIHFRNIEKLKPLFTKEWLINL